MADCSNSRTYTIPYVMGTIQDLADYAREN
jgi:hypothetical protein